MVQAHPPLSRAARSAAGAAAWLHPLLGAMLVACGLLALAAAALGMPAPGAPVHAGWDRPPTVGDAVAISPPPMHHSGTRTARDIAAGSSPATVIVAMPWVSNGVTAALAQQAYAADRGLGRSPPDVRWDLMEMAGDGRGAWEPECPCPAPHIEEVHGGPR
jgi:hypothetical protein